MSLDLPKAFAERMQQQLGAEYPAFLEALNAAPVVSLRLNPQKPGATFPDGSPIPWCDEGRYLPQRPQFFKDPLIYSGAYYVQEASSMLIAQMADFSKDMRILDLCASPGGKSTLLAAQMTPGSFLLSNEVVGTRARVLHEVMTRWGNPNTAVSCNHPRDFQAIENFFDLIVVDAPCSGEGMFRKDPAVIDTWKPSVVHSCAERQRDILAKVIQALKPGGRLIYSTCTYNEEENEQIVQWLLDHDPGQFQIVPHEFPASWGLSPGVTAGYSADMRYTYHCFPHKVKGEGFFLACLEKLRPAHKDGTGMHTQKAKFRNEKFRKGKSKSGRKGKGGKYRDEAAQGKPKKELGKSDFQLAATYLRHADLYELVGNNGAVEAIPKAMAADMQYLRDRLRLIKAGIALGIPQRGKFQPDHGLAMSEALAAHVPVIEVDAGQAMRYLSRNELQFELPSEKGWSIVVHAGRNLGWIKVLDKRINNHLPKHLRIRTDVSELY